jgi:hypothetical protein
MYMDKLDGRIGNDFSDRKAAEFRSEQCRVMRDIDTHRTANQSYIEDGIRLLDLAQRAPALFESQRPAEKRKLLDFVLSNCRWKDGRLEAEYRKPFDMLAVVVAAQNASGEGTAQEVAQNENWLPRRNPLHSKTERMGRESWVVCGRRWAEPEYWAPSPGPESGAGDEVIMSIAGHVSRAMLSRYSHVRMEAKRRALDEIAARQRAVDEKREAEAERPEQGLVVSQPALIH